MKILVSNDKGKNMLIFQQVCVNTSAKKKSSLPTKHASSSTATSLHSKRLIYVSSTINIIKVYRNFNLC